MKKEKTGFFQACKKGFSNLGAFLVRVITLLAQAIGALWDFIVNNIGRIIKIFVIVWILALLSILTVALSYWLLGLGSKYFVETGEKLQTLDMEGLLEKYPDIQTLLEESLDE